MRETEPNSLQPSRLDLDPPRKIRAAWWFGIYFAAQVPLIYYIAGFYLFPLGLSGLFPRSFFGSGETSGFVAIFLAAPYLFYLGHFIYSLNVSNLRAFRIALIVLVVVVVLNLAGCESMISGLHNIN